MAIGLSAANPVELHAKNSVIQIKQESMGEHFIFSISLILSIYSFSTIPKKLFQLIVFENNLIFS
jgi:hypothetical protein